jgi:hypothetical protein
MIFGALSGSSVICALTNHMQFQGKLSAAAAVEGAQRSGPRTIFPGLKQRSRLEEACHVSITLLVTSIHLISAIVKLMRHSISVLSTMVNLWMSEAPFVPQLVDLRAGQM